MATTAALESAEADPVVVGGAVKAARLTAGLTMTQLAKGAGVTQPFISQVESGKITPSISTLYRLAQVLAIAPSALLPAPALDGVTVVRAGGGHTIAQSERPNSPIGKILTGGGSHLEVIEYLVPAGLADDTTFSHPGEEVVRVLEGKAFFELEGHKSMILQPGDSVHFDALKSHRTTPYGPNAVRFLIIAAHPHRTTELSE
jgi:transcriptional regulator with XRE-family HTH domain